MPGSRWSTGPPGSTSSTDEPVGSVPGNGGTHTEWLVARTASGTPVATGNFHHGRESIRCRGRVSERASQPQGLTTTRLTHEIRTAWAPTYTPPIHRQTRRPTSGRVGHPGMRRFRVPRRGATTGRPARPMTTGARSPACRVQRSSMWRRDACRSRRRDSTRPPGDRPVVQRLQCLPERIPRLRELVGVGVRLLDQVGGGEFPKPVVEDARRHSVAPLPQRPGSCRPIAQLPEDPECPSTTEKVHGRHERPASRGSTDRNPIVLPPFGHDALTLSALRFDFENSTAPTVLEIKT